MFRISVVGKMSGGKKNIQKFQNAASTFQKSTHRTFRFGSFPCLSQFSSTSFVFFLSFGGIGFVPKMPGTAGSFAALIVFWGIENIFPESLPLQIGIFLGIFALLFFPSLVFIPRVTPQQNPDQSWIVIDEVLGMQMVLAPFFFGEKMNIWSALLAFALFRFFDILKPLGIARIDAQKTPLSVLLDDIIAGIYALILLLPIFFF